MNLSNDGLTLHFGTNDAPSPESLVSRAVSPVLTIGVEPPSPANSVSVAYKVDDGPTRTLTATESRIDYLRGVQYFTARFPSDLEGQKVAYCPIASCAGRRVPAHGAAEMLSSFRLTDPEPRLPPDPALARPPSIARFAPRLELQGLVTLKLRPPVVFGKTPLGFRVDYQTESGEVRGPKIRATVLTTSVDRMLVRTDGIGQIRVDASLRTDDGAMITVEYTGTADIGRDGYALMASGNLPPLLNLKITPRLLTEDSRYEWLNRLHFLGVGQIDTRELIARYDVYGVETEVLTGTSRP
jgi:hypothetical protein